MAALCLAPVPCLCPGCALAVGLRSSLYFPPALSSVRAGAGTDYLKYLIRIDRGRLLAPTLDSCVTEGELKVTNFYN